MSTDNQNTKPEKALDENQLDAVAGGTTGAGTLYPGQSTVPEPSTWAVDSGLGLSASGYSLDQPGQNKPTP